ncbi:antibiotic biosynthesis monooxygenase family protein [Caldiplasma sukawensis]
MIVTQNHIRVKKGREKEFEDSFIKREKNIKKIEGFVRTNFMRPIKGEDYIVETYWENLESFNAWLKSEDFIRSHKGLNKEILDGDNILTIHEIIG